MEFTQFNDGQLMILFAHGEERAFAPIFERNLSAVYRLSARMLGSSAEAEEATQEVFLRVAESAPTYTPDAAFSTWLHSITTRVCLNMLRARRAQKRQVPQTIPFPTFTPAHAASTLDAQDTAHALQEALETLEPDLRAAFVLRVFEHCSCAEVAARLNIPVGTAKTHIHRARCALRDALAQPQTLARRETS